MSKPRNYKSARTTAVIEQIRSFIEKCGQADTKQLAIETGMTQCHVGSYLRHMASVNLVVCMSDSVAVHRGRLPAVWVLGDVDLSDSDDMPRRVVVSSGWTGGLPAMFEPMAFLYGRAA